VQGDQPRAAALRRGGEDRGRQEGDRGEADGGDDPPVLEVQQEGGRNFKEFKKTNFVFISSFSKKKAATG
jgi:hypothetical protein